MVNSYRRRRILSVLPPEVKAKYPRLKKRKPVPPTAEEVERRERRAARIQEMEAGPMRTVARPHNIPDQPGDVAIYEFAVPYLVLALPSKYGARAFSTMEVVSFCEERGIRLPLGFRWHPAERTADGGRGFEVNILVFESVEDQRTVASAFPDRLF
jgi:hypothetical protein